MHSYGICSDIQKFKHSYELPNLKFMCLCACIHPTPLFYLFKFFHMEFHQKNNPARSCQNFTLSIHANMDLLQLLQMHMTTSSCDLKLAQSWLRDSQDHLSCKTSWLQPIFWDCLEKGLSLSTLEFNTLCLEHGKYDLESQFMSIRLLKVM